MKKVAVYIHGKGGSAEEAAYYEKFFNESYDVTGFDYQSELPWEIRAEFQTYFADIFSRYDEVILIANSIGAYYLLLSLSENRIKKAMLISPIVDMERLVSDMMQRAGVSEQELRLKKVVDTPFGESLSWEYLSYVRAHPITWKVPSSILYGKKDHITSFATITDFADRINADLTVMENGEHWFHTEEQMRFLDRWFENRIG